MLLVGCGCCREFDRSRVCALVCCVGLLFANSSGLLKVRHGVVREVGIVSKQLTNGCVAQLRVLRNF